MYIYDQWSLNAISINDHWSYYLSAFKKQLINRNPPEQRMPYLKYWEFNFQPFC